ncbi:MAG: hypothetical protein WBP10_03790 [Thermoanaerobaculia bacterium]
MTEVSDFALSKEDLIVINPGPGEYVHVMEGQRHRYQNLVVGITYIAPRGAPPVHTHLGEEAHVLTDKQKILYATTINGTLTEYDAESQRLRDDGRCSSRRRVSPETALAIECQ